MKTLSSLCIIDRERNGSGALTHTCFLLALVSISLLLASVTGCDRNATSSNSELVYWSANNPHEQTVARLVVEEWNRTHPDMRVHHQPVPEGQSSEEVILAAIISKTTPDIYSNVWSGDTEFYVGANALVRLDRFPDAVNYLEARCPEGIVESFRSRNGGLYQVPWKTNPIMMLYNVKAFREIGYEQPPRTYSEYLDAAQKLKHIGGDGFPVWIGFRDFRPEWRERLFDFYTFYIAASGGKTLLNGDNVFFENRHAVEVFQFFRTIYQNEYFAMLTRNLTGDLFLKNKIATRFTGPWEISRLEKFKSEDFEYGFAPIPVPDDHEGPVYTYGDIKNIVIFSTCTRPQAAWEFAKFLVSRKNDYRLLDMATQLPIRKDLLADSLFAVYFEINPRMIPFARHTRYVCGIDQSPVMKEVFDAIAAEYEEAVVYGTKTSEQAVRDAAARVRLILQ